MRYRALCHPGTRRWSPLRGRRGSTLAAALALAFIIFAVTTVSMARVAGSYTQITMRHAQSSALFLAEAGVEKAAVSLLADRTYSGEKGTRLDTGSFDVSVKPDEGGYVITSTGHVDSPLKNKPRKTVQATVRLVGSTSFRIIHWREDP